MATVGGIVVSGGGVEYEILRSTICTAVRRCYVSTPEAVVFRCPCGYVCLSIWRKECASKDLRQAQRERLLSLSGL